MLNRQIEWNELVDTVAWLLNTLVLLLDDDDDKLFLCEKIPLHANHLKRGSW
jgi:hypothetical protein